MWFSYARLGGTWMKVVVFTLGCKVNMSESDSLMSALKDKGYEVFEDLVYADIYIVNTCAVTSEAERKSRQTVSRITKINPNAKIIFTGCATQRSPDSFKDKKGVTVVTGTFSKSKILDLIDEHGVFLSPEIKEFEELLPAQTKRSRAYIKVQDGCNNFCSYCIIPYLRGRTRSRNPESVINEINYLNPCEAVINGINLTSYNYQNQNLTSLIKSLNGVNSRIRLGSLEINVIDKDFLLALKDLKDFAPHFHLSLQSGSDSVLKSMNRKYTSSEFIEKVNLIREYFVDAGITTDIIVGFPTETEEYFNETLDLVKKVKFSDVHAFPFSPRSGTVAYKMQDLDKAVKSKRLQKLLEVKEEFKKDFILSNIGKTHFVVGEEVIDGYTVGYTGNYIRTYIKGDYAFKKIKVKLIKEYKDGVLAEKGE